MKANYEKTTQKTEWKDVPLNSGFTQAGLASSGNLRYRREGNLVELRGSVKGFTEANTACGNIPTGYRPSTRIDFYGGTGGNYLAKCMVTPGGNINLLASTKGTYSKDDWFSFCKTWITDEDFPS